MESLCKSQTDGDEGVQSIKRERRRTVASEFLLLVDECNEFSSMKEQWAKTGIK